MKALPIVVIVIAILVLATALWYTQMNRASPTSNPAPTTTMPTATTTPITTPTPSITIPTTMPPASTVTAKLNQKMVDIKPYTGDDVLLINGTVTNDSPNTAYSVGLHVFAPADPALYPFEEDVDVTVPVASGIYNATSTYALSTIPPNQSVIINIEIIPPASLSEMTVIEEATVTLIWSNP
jgi:hypothetical protein